jgi:hypothetical protein
MIRFIFPNEARRAEIRASTVIGTVAGCTFVECPTRGQDVPLYLLDGHSIYSTDYYELPSAEDLAEDMNEEAEMSDRQDEEKAYRY